MKKLVVAVGFVCPDGYNKLPFADEHPLKAVKALREYVENMPDESIRKVYVTSPHLLECVAKLREISEVKLDVKVDLVDDNGKLIEEYDDNKKYVGITLKECLELLEDPQNSNPFDKKAGFYAKMEVAFWGFNRAFDVLDSYGLEASTSRMDSK